jgi:hypothetical protein
VISFTVITSTPLVFRNQLLNRGIVEPRISARDGSTSYVGVKNGLEWIEVPNPIVTTLATGVLGEVGYVPAVMDTRRVFLVKMAQDMHDDQIDGIEQDDVTTVEEREVRTKKALILRTKWGQWIMANSTADTVTSADGRSWPARKVGTATWFVASDDFGVWQ